MSKGPRNGWKRSSRIDLSYNAVISSRLTHKHVQILKHLVRNTPLITTTLSVTTRIFLDQEWIARIRSLKRDQFTIKLRSNNCTYLENRIYQLPSKLKQVSFWPRLMLTSDNKLTEEFCQHRPYAQNHKVIGKGDERQTGKNQYSTC